MPDNQIPLGGNQLQQIDTDIQSLTKAVNRIAEILTQENASQTPLVVTGSRGGNAALASLLTVLANSGVIVDQTTA